MECVGEGRVVPPVLSQSSRQIFVSAASATSEIRMRSLTQDERVSKILPGSTVVSEPKMISISREEWVGRWLSRPSGKQVRHFTRREKKKTVSSKDNAHLMLLRAISMAFWRLGSPTGSSLCLSEIALSTSCGFPVVSPAPSALGPFFSSPLPPLPAQVARKKK